MNKIIQINLGGFPFTIDEDAFEVLSKYLSSLKAHFKKSESKEEIIADIESRLAELLGEQLAGRVIVGKADVEAAIKIMGTPEDFGVEADGEPTKQQEQKSSHSTDSYHTGKKLYRDTQNKMVGGVCSGIAAYFGIEDPLWVRIAFVVAGLTFGFGFPLYIIVMLFVPKAENAADRLAMRGKPINVTNIANIIENEIERLSNKISGIDEKVNTEGFSTSSSKAEHKEKSHQILEEGVSIIATAFNYALKFFGKIFQSLGLVTGIFLMILTLIIWVGLFIFFFKLFSMWTAVLGSKLLTILALISIFFFITVPLASMVLFLLRVIKRVKISPTLRWGIWGGYSVNIALLFLLGSLVGSGMSKNGNVIKSYNTTGIKSDTLMVDIKKQGEDHSFSHEVFGFVEDETSNSFVSKNVNIRIEKSDNDNFEVVQYNKSLGKTESEASARAALITSQSEMIKNKLFINKSFSIPNSEKIRNQNIDYILKVPVGKYIQLSKEASWLVYDFPYAEENESPEGYDHVWKMTENGLICPKYMAENKVEDRNISTGAFRKLQIDGNFKVIVIKSKSENEYSFSITGKKDVYEKVERSQPNDYLQLSLKEESDTPLELTIMAWELDAIDLENVSECKILGFNQKTMRVTTVGNFELDMTGDVENLSLNIEETIVSLKGVGKNLNLDNDNGEVNAKSYEIKTAEINDRDGKGSLFVSDLVSIKGNEDAYKVKGGATVKKIKTKDDEE